LKYKSNISIIICKGFLYIFNLEVIKKHHFAKYYDSLNSVVFHSHTFQGLSLLVYLLSCFSLIFHPLMYLFSYDFRNKDIQSYVAQVLSVICPLINRSADSDLSSIIEKILSKI
jgi:hypothetical protein